MLVNGMITVGSSYLFFLVHLAFGSGLTIH